MEASLAVHEFLKYVVVKLINHPDDASVLHEKSGERHLYKIRLHPDDAGRVIGKGGKTIGAIRSLAVSQLLQPSSTISALMSSWKMTTIADSTQRQLLAKTARILVFLKWLYFRVAKRC